jgi:hypothetical protein
MLRVVSVREHGKIVSLPAFTDELRVLTTTARKPPLRTDTFLGFRGELLRQSLRCGGQSAQNPVTAHFQARKHAL